MAPDDATMDDASDANAAAAAASDAYMHDASPYVPQQPTYAAMHIPENQIKYKQLEQHVEYWAYKNNRKAFKEIKDEKENLIEFFDYTEFYTKVMQCLRMMCYCDSAIFIHLHDFVVQITTSNESSTAYFNWLRGIFDNLKQRVLAQYQLAQSQIQQQGGGYKRKNKKRGGDANKEAQAVREAQEAAFQKEAVKRELELYQVKVREALDIVNEHFILGYDTPPNRKMWNLVNAHYKCKEWKK
jgi:hypothetical protein